MAAEEFSAKAMMAAGAQESRFVARRRNRAVLDCAPYLLRQMIAYKTKLYGSRRGLGGALKDDKRFSTEVCAECCGAVSKSASHVWRHCPNCGYPAKRRHHAARVILMRAQDRGGPKYRPAPTDAKSRSGPVCPVVTGMRLRIP